MPKGEEVENVEVVRPECTHSGQLTYDRGLKLTVNVEHGYICGLSFEEGIMPIQVEKANSLSYVFSSQNKIAGEVNVECMITSNFASKLS